MGITGGRDNYSPKYVTAEIMDASKRLHVVPIKYTIGDYFLTDINKQVYCFQIDPARIMTHRETLTKSYRVMWFTTKNYHPISAGDMSLLEHTLRENNLPHVENKLLSTFKILGKREKKDQTFTNEKAKAEFQAHQLQSLVQEISVNENEYTVQAENMKNYLEHLRVDQIVTPVKEVSEFLDNELIVPDAKFFGDIVSTLQRVDQEHKKVTNVPITGKLPWFKIILITSLVGILGGMGYWLYESGAFSNFSLGGFGGFGMTQNSQDIMKEYPTPESLKVAISQGKIKESDLPADIKREVDAIKLPATPPK